MYCKTASYRIDVRKAHCEVVPTGSTTKIGTVVKHNNDKKRTEMKFF